MSTPELASQTAAPKPLRSDREYEYWRWRILFGTMIGYIFFYFVRKSVTMAMPGLEEIGVTKTTLGLFLTIHGVLYGVARFVNGVWSDRVNPRYFMSIGLFLAALTNVFCGCSGTLADAFGVGPESRANAIAWIIGSFWIVNGWVQGMGFPPCAKSLTHWFAPREHGVKFATWNISHSFGAGLVFLLNSFVVAFGWKYCFLVPAALSIAGSVFLFWALRDAPEKEGFEPIEQYYERTRGAKKSDADANANANAAESAESAGAQAPCARVAEPVDEEPDAGWWGNLCKHVFSNRAIWILCFANFFVYIVRFSILDWAPTFLSQAKGLDLKEAGWATACYEVFGAFGIVLSGVLMDKVFNNRGAKACFVYTLGCAVASFAFWRLDSSSIVVNILLLSLIGFFIYGPQCLIGCVAATVATKKAGAASSGLTGLFGYLATIVTGFGVGAIVDSATAPFKAERDQNVAAVLTESFVAAKTPGFDAAAFGEKLGSDGNLGAIVKASEGSFDACRHKDAVFAKMTAAPKKGLEAQANFEKKRAALTEKLGAVAGVSDVPVWIVEKAEKAAGEGRAKISQAGWPRVFGLLVVSSIAALILFATILNVASPEIKRLEAEKKAAKNA